MKKSQRVTEIDKLKGFAIFLVVLGHIVARDPPANNEWYVSLKASIYLFHMPLFMFLSGLILAYARKPVDSINAYGKYLRGKFMRLMPAYLLFSLVVFAGKFAMGKFVHVDNGVDSVLSYFDVLINPLSSYCAYLWYIYVLFIFYALAPIAYRLTRERIEWLLPFALILHFVQLPGLFALSSLGEYSFVFVLGCCAGDHYQQFSKWVEKTGPAFVVVFIVAACFSIPWGVPKFMLGLLSIPACYALMVGMRITESWGILKKLGAYTFPIYLMNTVFIGVTKGVMLKLSSWDGTNFLWFAPLLLAAGIIGPILTKELLFRRISTLDRMVA